MQHGALVEERMAGGGLRYRRPAAAPDAFAATGGAAICEDPEDDDLMPSRSLQPAKENGCKVFLPVRAPLPLRDVAGALFPACRRAEAPVERKLWSEA